MLYNTDKNDKDKKATKPLLSRFYSEERNYDTNDRAEIFDRIFRTRETAHDIERVDNVVGQGENSVTYPNGMSPHGAFGSSITHDPHTSDPHTLINQLAERALLDHWKNNREKTMKYQRMLKRPEISDAITVITNDALYADDNGNYATLKIDDDIDIGLVTKRYMQKRFKSEVVKKCFDLKNEGKKIMRDLLSYGRVFWEIIYDPKSNKIVGLNKLPQHNMLIIIYEGEVIGYRQMLEGSYISSARANNGKNYIDYSTNQILWADLGSWGPGGPNDPYGILEDAVKSYNQLNAIEDAVTMYRIAWGSEKLQFKINVNNMPKKLAEAYIREQKNELSRRVDYNTSTGEIVNSGRIIGLSEHYFIPTTASGGHEISRIAAGDNIAKIDDVNHFRNLLVNAMKVPARMITAFNADPSNFTSGKMGEITQEQVKFYRQIMQYQLPINNAMVRLFTMILSLDPMIPDEFVNEDSYDVQFSRANYFQFYMDAEINSTRFSALNEAKDHIGTMFSRKFALRRLFKITDEEESLNDQWLQEEKARGDFDETEEGK